MKIEDDDLAVDPAQRPPHGASSGQSRRRPPGRQPLAVPDGP